MTSAEDARAAPDGADLQTAYRQAAELLASGKRFLLTGHRNPDGDALGSCLALALALEAAGREARIVVRDPWASVYDRMPGIQRVAVVDALPPDWPSGWDALVVMECPDPERVGFPSMGAGSVLDVDHHPGNTRYGTVNLVDVTAAAVGEIVADLLDLLGWPISAPIATNLWIALVSDTGSFRYSNTTPKALALGARLVAAGARPGQIAEQLFESAPLSAVKLESRVMATLALHDGGRVATLELPRRFFTESGAKESDTENLVNRARGISGVRAAALLSEGEVGEIRCSLRSKGAVDVRAVAGRHGGGGHRNASGCRLKGTLDSARAALVPELAGAVAAAEASE